MAVELVEIALFSDEVPTMVSFYQHILDSEPITQTKSMAVFLVGKTKILIHASYVAEPGDLPPDNHVAFGVEDVDSACLRLVQQGVTLEAPPIDYCWRSSAYLRDPGGLLIEITQALA
jgi:catechol 2,3-dioxygenase-like lactoylglutathione lyase family enzyme